MYERFTDRARKVMQLANQEAQRCNHQYIAPEHILLGLVKEGSGVAANVLKNLDIDLRKIRLEVEKIVQSGPDMVTMGKLPQTPAAKKVIENAIASARSLNMNYIGTEHLLLGLFDDPPLMTLFSQLGVTRQMVEQGIRKMLKMDANETKNPFTQRSLLVLDLANKAAVANDSQMVGSPHLLLGLLQEGKGLACQVLANLDTNVQKLKDALWSLVPPVDFRGSFNVGKVPLGKEVEKILEGAVAEAKAMEMEENIGTEHILLAMFGDPFLLKLFQEVGLRYSQAKEEIQALCPQKPPIGTIVYPAACGKSTSFFVGENPPTQQTDSKSTLTYNTHKLLVTALPSEEEMKQLRAEFEKAAQTTPVLLPSSKTPYTYHQKNKDGSEFTITFATYSELTAFAKEQLRGQNPESDTDSCFCM